MDYVYTLLFNRKSLFIVTKPPFAYLSFFWFLYLFSGVFSSSLYGVPPNVIIFNGIKIAAFLLATASLSSFDDIFKIGALLLILGVTDILLGFFGLLQWTVNNNTRELGALPWLRYDTISLSLAFLLSFLAYPVKFSYSSNIGVSFWKFIFRSLLVICFVSLFLYGLALVQLRVYLLEAFLGVVLILYLHKRSRLKILLSTAVVIIASLIVWKLLDIDLQTRTVAGLFGRSDGGRIELWSYSFRVWFNSPIFGHGFGTDGLFLSQFDLPGRQGSHSAYLILAIEVGIVGVISWLIINTKAINLIYLAHLNSNRTNQQRSIWFVFVLHLMSLFHLLFHGLIYFPWTIILPAVPFTIMKKLDLSNLLTYSDPIITTSERTDFV